MKKTYLLIAGIVAIALGISYLAFAATDCGTAWPTSYDNYSAGCIIHSALFNNIEQSIGLNPTSTPLTNKVGNISGVVNTSTISLNVSGTGLSEATTSNSITITLASSSYLQPSNNLSDVASAATARTNLGLGDAATLSSSTWLKVSNNLSDLNNTATARTNLGLGSSATHPSNDYLSSSTSYVSSINGATGTYYLLGGNDVTIATSSTSSVISVNTSAAAAGSSTDVQYNDNGTFGATSTFTYNSSTGQLALTASPASLVVGSSSQFSATTTLTLLYSETGASTSFQIPPGVNSITINAQGAGSGGEGGSVTGTLAVIPGTTYYIDVGGSNGYNGGGSAGGGAASPGGGMTWFSASSTFSTSTVILVAGGGGGTGVSAGGLSAGGGGGGYFGGGGGSVNGTNGTNGSAGQGGNGSFNGGFSGGPSPGVGGFGGGLTAGSGTGGSPGLGGSQTAGGGITGGTGAGSGGGGSSYLSPSLSATSSATGTVSGNGSLSITFVPPYGLKVDGHIITGGASPTLSNGTVAGTDETGHVTVSSSTSAYTLVFGSPWDNAPACTAAMSSGTAAYFQNIASVSTSTVFTANTSLATSSIFQYLCLGY